MRVIIKPEFQIQRINTLSAKLEELKSLPFVQLITRPNATSWSPVEVLLHMVVAHNAYQEKVTPLLQKATHGTGLNELKTSAIPSFLIKRFPPKEGIIRFKMKTMKKFNPMLDSETLDESELSELFVEMEHILNELKDWVNTYRTKNVSMKKFNSAIGATVRFNVPEACEFILCHNERHFQQITNALVISRSSKVN